MKIFFKVRMRSNHFQVDKKKKRRDKNKIKTTKTENFKVTRRVLITPFQSLILIEYLNKI